MQDFAVMPGASFRVTAGTDAVNKTNSEVRRVHAEMATVLNQRIATFLTQDVSAKELQSVRNTAKVASLEKYGITLEKQVQWFGLRLMAQEGHFQAAEKAVRQDSKEAAADGSDQKKDSEDAKQNKMSWGERRRTRRRSSATTEDKSSTSKSSAEMSFFGRRRTRRRSSTATQDKSLTPRTSADYDERAKANADEGFAEFMEATADNTMVDAKEIKEDLEAFKELDADSMRAVVLEERRLIEGENAQKGNRIMSNQSNIGTGLSERNFEAYKKWKKSRAHIGPNWWLRRYDKWIKGVSLGETHQHEHDVKQLYSSLWDMYDRLARIKNIIQYYESLDWEEVEEHKVLTLWQSIGKSIKNGTMSIVHGVASYTAKVWRKFKSLMIKEERKCVMSSQKREQKAMKKAKMRSPEEMEQAISQKGSRTDDEHSEAIEAELDKELNKADKVIDKTVTLSDKAEKKLEKDTAELKDAGEQVQAQALEGQINDESMKELSDKTEDITKVSCKAKEGWMVRKLKSLHRALVVAADMSLPTIGTRGIGGTASVLGGGVEEVIDFWNREIGLFAWGGLQVGTNSLTAGAGGYAGVGWKGYKLDWSLQETVQTCRSQVFSASIPFPIPVLSAGVAVSMGLDADDSNPYHWVLDLAGTNAVNLGWSVSVGPSLMFGGDLGQYRYHMITSECFYDQPLWKFIAMIWAPWCLNCTGVLEKTLVGATRLAIKVASYPVITDIIHSVIALRMATVRKKHEKLVCRKEDGTGFEVCDNVHDFYNPELPAEERCSERSTKFRDDIVRMFKLVAIRLADSTDLLDQIMQQYDAFVLSIARGGEKNKKVTQSKELKDFWKSLQAEFMTYTRAPPERLLSLSGAERAQKVWEDLRKLRKRTLTAKCNALPDCKKYFGKRFYTKAEIVDRVARAVDKASKRTPFGSCTNDKDCELANVQGRSVFKRMSAKSPRECICRKMDVKTRVWNFFRSFREKCPKLTGLCRCREGWRYTKERGRPTCIRDNLLDTIRKDLKGGTKFGFDKLKGLIHAWKTRRNIELGSAKKVLVRLMEEVGQSNMRLPRSATLERL
jgi:hypothetical protein